MLSPKCPDRDKLAAFAFGRLPVEALEPVAEHVRTCPTCESTITDLEHAGDTFVAELRGPAVEEEFLAEPGFAHALALAKRVAHSPEGRVQASEDRFFPSPGQMPTSLFQSRESACERFEQAWRTWRDTGVGSPPRIADYLSESPAQGENSSGRELLIELVGMDLEYRWRSVGEGKPLHESSEALESVNGPLLAGYLATFPALGPREELPADLIAEEYRARRLGGDRPTHEEYLAEYAAWRPTLDELLAQTDWELARLQEGTLIRDYRLLRKIGRGGMGTVYQAVHTKLNKVVAVKVLPQERLKDPEAVLRFQREMRAVGNLRHPNIVEALDAGEADGMHYLVMEYVDGCDLGKVLDRIGPLPVAEACEVMRQAALGLQHAHEQGRVHRDVKPSNLMLSTDCHVKVLDLGLARLREDLPSAVALSTGDRLMGTADFMAPEQAANTHTADIRADVYSLGCTLYSLLAGQPPFSGPQYQSRAEKLVGHARDPAAPIDTIRPDVPEQLVGLINGMLSKSPDRRPPTPGEIAQALEPFVNGADLAGLLEAARQGRCLSPILIAQSSSKDLLPSAVLDAETQLASRPTVAATPRRPVRWKRLAILAAAASVALFAVIITIVTDRGTLEIKTLDEHVRVSVSRNGHEVTLVDTETGSTVSLRSGDYKVKLIGGRNGLCLDKDSITIRRGKREVLKVSIVTPPRSPGDPDPWPLQRNDPGGWVIGMFGRTSHDFGTIARGARTEYRFDLMNPYVEDVHVSSVESSTSVFTASATKTLLKAFERAEIVVQLNSENFQGAKAGTITVKIDRPYPAEMLLNVTCLIGGNTASVSPPLLAMGIVATGQPLTRRLEIRAASPFHILEAAGPDARFNIPLPESAQVMHILTVQFVAGDRPGEISSTAQDYGHLQRMRSFR